MKCDKGQSPNLAGSSSQDSSFALQDAGEYAQELEHGENYILR